MIRLTRLSIRSYRGIKTLDLDVPTSTRGAIARGRNGSGKTSVLNAIGAALAASDLGADAVRIGEEDGEILIDLDLAGKALHVRRRFGAAGSTLQVTNDDGDRKAKPATMLAELLGSSPLDVVGVVLEKDKKKRRSLILAALPVRVSVEQLRRYVPQLPDTYDVSGHGLEVIERLRAAAYEKRAVANKAAKEAKDAAGTARHAAANGWQCVPENAEPLDVAQARHAEAVRTRDKLEATREASERARASTEGLRVTAANARTKAAEERAIAETRPTDAECEAAVAEYDRLDAEVREIERRRDEAHRLRHDVEERLRLANDATARAERLDADAARIEAGIAQAVEVVDPAQVEAAAAAVLAAREAHEGALARTEAEARELVARAAEDAAKVAKVEADRLDAVVQSLTLEAPAALLAESAGAPAGLELDGDDVRLGGVSLDRLCGAEQMRFAADIAKALNPGVGFLVVDGLERLDPEQLEAFVEAATAGGRQLFGSLVDRGELALAAIEHDQAEAAE